MAGLPLTPERWRTFEAILLAAWDAPAEERDVILQQRCSGDAALLAELRSLLAADVSASHWVSPAADQPTLPARRAGPYAIERLIGRGGMGAVYLAHRADGQFEQKVAVKLIGLPFEIESFRERFRRERQILATLDHPNITRLFDGGVTPDGDLFLAMEYVDGIPLDEYCRQPGRSVDDRVRLFRQVCAAVQYAHQNLIIHRDIKHSNILVTPDGTPKLLDFGTAKLMADADTTQTGLGLMSAAYASPEQLRGDTVSTLTDVFSLGVVLCELITGEKLFAGDVTGRLATVGQPSLASSLNGDLRRILGKALAADPAQRYSSVEQLSEDLRRFLDGEAVLAHPPSFSYRAAKYLRRHRWGVALTTATIFALSTAALFSARQAQIAQRQADRARKISDFSKQTLLSPVPRWGTPLSGHPGEITLETILDNAGRRAGQDLASDPATEAEIRSILGATWIQLGNSSKGVAELNRALERARLVTDQPFDNERASIFELLCNVESNQGDYPKAQSYCQAALATLSKAAQPNPDLAFSIPHDLAFMLDKNDAPLDEVERSYRASAEAARRYFGTGDVRWSIAMTRVALCRSDAGDLAEAAAILEPIVAHLRTLPGPPVDLIPPLRGLGIMRRTQGRLKESQALFEEALDLLHKRPVAYFSADLIELNLLLARALDGRALEVLPRARKLLEKLTAGVPPGHLDRAQPELLAARILALAHRRSEADPLFMDAAAIFHARLPHRPTLEAEARSVL